ncbi:MAG: hypothetical protein B6229_07495 [Spirochaetaceae bacterium 4572_7]|nr:MAG: hypothetical protein B6229_07495 [Spirochaetaceae bacterium 4572_7]
MIERIITGDLDVNTYLYNYREGLVVIIDPGSDSDKIKEQIATKGFIPKAIILTHGHFDHIGAVKIIKDFFNIPVYIHTEDATFLGPKSIERHTQMFSNMGPQGAYYLDKYLTESDDPDFIIKDQDILKEFNLRVIHTPGHSPGSICLYAEENSILFTGDTLFKSGIGRTDFTGGDYKTLISSLDKLWTLPENTKIYPGHGATSTISLEIKSKHLY